MTDGNPLTMPATWPEWLSLANVLLTATFAFLTFLILRANRAAVAAMRDQMADQNRPYVHVSVQVRLGTPVLQLLVRNVGRSPAENLRLHIDRDFYQFGERSKARNLAEQSAFTKPIDCLPPMSELLFDLGMGFKIFAADADPAVCPPPFVVSAEYGHGKSTYSEKTHVDLRPYMGTSVPHHPVVEELQRVRKSIDKLSGAAKQAAAALIQANRAEGKE
ncbi:hypothetical protein ACSO6A_002748 [Pseudomonas aeruginosa]|nr:hypothetical protein [Pseudomonas aeruginosa]